MFKPNTGLAAVVALMLGGMIAFSLDILPGLGGLRERLGPALILVALTHAACVFFPFRALLEAQERLHEARDEVRRARE